MRRFTIGFLVFGAAALSVSLSGCGDDGSAAAPGAEPAASETAAAEDEGQGLAEVALGIPRSQAHCISRPDQVGQCHEFRVVMEAVRQLCEDSQGTWGEGECARENAIGTCDRRERLEVYYSSDFDAESAAAACAAGFPPGDYAAL